MLPSHPFIAPFVTADFIPQKLPTVVEPGKSLQSTKKPENLAVVLETKCLYNLEDEEINKENNWIPKV